MARGIVLYRGPSLIDGGPIVAIASLRSTNSKTGDCPQIWIVREDSPPVRAARSGADRSVCGDCPLRGTIVDGRNVGRACYVVLHQAPSSVWLAYRRGAYREAGLAQVSRAFAGAFVRLGAYGDPAAVPLKVWRAVLADARGWTAYTHQWRAAELQALFERLATRETYFFRESYQLDALAQEILPPLLRGGEPLSLWSAGCSTGEEAYTLAITALRAGARAPRVVGTDLSQVALEAADAAVYGPGAFRQTADALREGYFRPEEGGRPRWRASTQ